MSIRPAIAVLDGNTVSYRVISNEHDLKAAHKCGASFFLDWETAQKATFGLNLSDGEALGTFRFRNPKNGKATVFRITKTLPEWAIEVSYTEALENLRASH